MAIYFRARDRREVPASEALDARGILRPGYGQRVPHTMRDAAPRFTDARAFWDANNLLVTDARAIGGVEGCKPGFRVSDSPINRQAIVDAYADYRRDLESAWRTPSRDAAFGAPPYGAYPLSAGEGNQCSINGAPGTLVREGDVLVCRPLAADAAKPPRDPDEDEDDENGDDEDDGETTADARIATVDAMSARHQQNMSRIYDQIAIDLSQQWREGK